MNQPDAMSRIRARFLQDCGRWAIVLREALVDARLDEIKAVSHKLCGLAGTIGFSGISELAATVEDLIDAHKGIENIAPATLNLADELERQGFAAASGHD